MAYLIQLIVLASLFIVPALSDGAQDKRYLIKCDGLLKETQTGDLMQHLVDIVKVAVHKAEEDWPYVGLEVDDSQKYADILSYSNEKLAEPGKHGFTGEEMLRNAKIVSFPKGIWMDFVCRTLTFGDWFKKFIFKGICQGS
jgi:hypothetical protein